MEDYGRRFTEFLRQYDDPETALNLLLVLVGIRPAFLTYDIPSPRKMLETTRSVFPELFYRVIGENIFVSADQQTLTKISSNPTSLEMGMLLGYPCATEITGEEKYSVRYTFHYKGKEYDIMPFVCEEITKEIRAEIFRISRNIETFITALNQYLNSPHLSICYRTKI